MKEKGKDLLRCRRISVLVGTVLILLLVAAGIGLLLDPGGNSSSQVSGEEPPVEGPSDGLEGQGQTLRQDEEGKNDSQDSQKEENQESEADERKGLADFVEQNIRNGHIQVWDVSDAEEDTAFALDLDGDGSREEISIRWMKDGAYTEYDHYLVTVDGQEYEDYGENVEPKLLAVSLDGDHILLALFEEGPSGDPETSFYYFNGTDLSKAGEIPGDIRILERDEAGYLRCGFRADVIQTTYAFGYWYWDGSQVVRREDEGYVCTDNRDDFSGTDPDNRNWIILKEAVEVYPEKDESSKTVTLKPQKVMELMTDAEEWTYLKGEDGTEGWLHVAGVQIPSLDNKLVMDVFEGLFMAD